MSGKSSSFGSGGSISGPGGRTRRKTSGDKQPLNVEKCKELLQDMLVSSGQRELLKRLVQSRLAQSGWTYSMRSKYMEYIRKKGNNNVNVSQMIAENVPNGLESFPTTVRKEVAEILWEFAIQHINVDDTVTPPPETDSTCGHSELSFQYQNKDVKPDPGLGINVSMPELEISRSVSPISVPRPLTPQPPIPILRPEKVMVSIIKEEPVEEEDEMSEMEDDEEEEEDERNDDEEEELMDV